MESNNKKMRNNGHWKINVNNNKNVIRKWFNTKNKPTTKPNKPTPKPNKIKTSHNTINNLNNNSNHN